MPGKTVDMGFTKREFPVGAHMCLVYSDERDRRRVIGKFLTSGLLEHERVAYFADVMTEDDVVDWLAEFEIDLSAADSEGGLLVRDATETYCPDGRFDVDGMLGRLKKFHIDAASRGCGCARVSGEMSWALKDIPGSENLMLYEARVNDVFRTHPVTAICQYDANLFDGRTIMDVLKVHPMMIVKDRIVHNPYYLKTEDFIAEHERRKA